MLKDLLTGATDAVKTWLRRHRAVLTPAALILSLVPVLMVLAYVRAFGVTAVYADQWEMVSIFRNSSAGTLTFVDLFRLHNEHRFFFPRIVMLTLGSLTAWSNIAEMYLIALLLAASTGIMFLAFRRSLGGEYAILFVPGAFLVLTFKQHLNLLWGYQITFALTQFAAVASLYALYSYTSRVGSGRWVAFFGALALGVIASGSSVQGLMVWFAGLLLLLLTAKPARDDGPAPPPNTEESLLQTGWWAIVLWGLAGISVWVLYFFDYQPTGAPSSPLAVLLRPVFGVAYGLSTVGAPLTFGQPRVILAGALVLASLISTIYLLFRRGGREMLGRYSFWISLCAFSLLVLALITAGRYASGLDGATASRYVTFSAPLVASLYALTVGLWRETRDGVFPTLQLASVALVVLASQITYLNDAYIRGVESKQTREDVAQTILTRDDRTDRELFEEVNFGAKAIRNRADTLEQLGYNVYATE